MSWAEQESLTKNLEALSAQNQSLQARYKEDVQRYGHPHTHTSSIDIVTFIVHYGIIYIYAACI